MPFFALEDWTVFTLCARHVKLSLGCSCTHDSVLHLGRQFYILEPAHMHISTMTPQFACRFRYENMDDSVEQADSAMTGLAQLTLGTPPPNCRDPLKDSPLAELLYPALPQTLQAPTEVQDVLLVLKLLECLNR